MALWCLHSQLKIYSRLGHISGFGFVLTKLMLQDQVQMFLCLTISSQQFSMTAGYQWSQSAHNSFDLWRPSWSLELLRLSWRLVSAVCLFAPPPFLSLFVVWLWKRCVTPFVSTTDLSKQRFGGPTCRSPGTGHSLPWASQDYPQRRRQLRPGEGTINLHKLQPATLPPLSLDTQIMHLLLYSPQTEWREGVIFWFPTTKKLFPEVQLLSGPWFIAQHFLTLQMGKVAWGFVAWKNIFLILGYFWFREHCPFILLQDTFTNGALLYNSANQTWGFFKKKHLMSEVRRSQRETIQGCKHLSYDSFMIECMPRQIYEL